MTAVASVVSHAPAFLEKRPSRELDTKIAAQPFDFDSIMRGLLMGLDQSHHRGMLSIPYSVFQEVTFEELKELVVQSMVGKSYSDLQISKATSILTDSYLECLTHSPVRICANTLETEIPELLKITS